jgi:hypothetical protein
MAAIEGGEVPEAREGGAGMRDGGAAMGVSRLEVGEEADGWAPSARERRRERRGAGAGGPAWAENRDGPRGIGLGLLFFFFFFFSFSFSNPFLNQFQTFLDSNLLHLFKFNFNTNFSKYFKGFSQFLTTFQTYFKFKPLHKFSQLSFHNYFLRTFHKYFKTFKTTPQPKLMHSNHDAQALISSKLLK